MLRVDEDGSNDDVILIVNDEKRKKREVDLVEKSGTNFVEMGVFSKTIVDSHDQKGKSIDFKTFDHELIGSNEFIKPMVVQKGDSTDSGGSSVDFDDKSVVSDEAQLLEIVHSPKLLALEIKVEYIEGGSTKLIFFY